MEIPIISIGNSKGIRLPKTILEQYEMSDTLEMILEEGRIILTPAKNPRKGWEAAFQAMHENGDDHLLIDSFFEDETLDEWM